MTKLLYSLLAILCVCLSACQTEQIVSPYPNITIGGDSTLPQITLHKKMQRNLFLKGGNGKYHIHVADPQIATASIHFDTLKVSGLLEGETSATIFSHDQSITLSIAVTFPQPGFSKKVLRIYPQEINQTISLTGGGERMKLEVTDPDTVVNVLWNAKTGYLMIKGRYEGDATLTAISEDGTREQLKIMVRCEDSISAPGIYGTDQRYYSSNTLTGKIVMIVEQPQQGVWFMNTTRPYGGYFERPRMTGNYIKISPHITNPSVGEKIRMSVINTDDRYKFRTGEYEMTVEEVRPSHVLLQQKGLKILLPYSSND